MQVIRTTPFIFHVAMELDELVVLLHDHQCIAGETEGACGVLYLKTISIEDIDAAPGQHVLVMPSDILDRLGGAAAFQPSQNVGIHGSVDIRVIINRIAQPLVFHWVSLFESDLKGD